MAIEDGGEAALDFEGLFNRGAHPCLVVQTLPAHTIVAVNDRFLAVTGLQRAGVLGLGLFDVFPDKYFGHEVAELRASLERVVHKREQDVMDVQKCDPVRPAAAAGAVAEYWRLINTPVFAADAQISFILQHAEDVTDFVRAGEWHSRASAQQAETARAPEAREVARTELERREAELANLDERIQNIDQARAKFFSNVSRELRTPLTLLLGPLDDILDSPAASLAPDSRAVLELARGNALRLLELVDSLLDAPAVDTTRTGPAGEPTDLATFTADLASNFRSACEWDGLNLTVDCPPQPAPVRVDRDMWEKIVLNLIANAFKFTSEGTIEVRLRVLAGSAELTVRDTGSGFAESELPQLFERFHSASGARAGVGLAVVRDLVQTHNGSIDVHSELGRGSTFTVRIPLVSDRLSTRVGENAAAANAAASTASGTAALVAAPVCAPLDSKMALGATATTGAAVPGARGRVVVADDNADMRAYLGHLLESAGYEVEALSDGIAALSACQAQLPDAVISDVLMPGLDGLALIERLRADEHTAVIPVLLLSGRAGEDSRIAGLAAGADDYLIKPFGRRELVARVDGAVNLSRLRQEAARREQDAIESLFSMAPEGVIVVGPDGQILKANLRAQQLFGYSQQEFLDLDVKALLPVDFRAALHGHLATSTRATVAGEDSNKRILHGRRRDGSEFPAEIDVGPLQFKNQACTIAIVRDITERKRIEERLFEAQKLEAISQLTGGLAHDFNNLLGIILGSLDLLDSGLADDQARRHHDAARRAGLRAAQITKSLLAVARKQALEPREVDVGEALLEMMSLIRQTVGGNISVRESRSADCAASVFAHVDPIGLSNAILNLVTNARDAMPKGGTLQVGIELRSVDSDDLGAPPDLAPGRYIVLSVADSGAGMPAQVAARAFEPFFTTKERGHGTGLGLAMVYGFARQSGGTATIFSQPDLGTTVRLFLPVSEATASERSVAGQPTEVPTPGRGERILVVDDEEMLLDVTHEWLQRLGYHVEKSTSPTEALDILRRDHFDMLLTDVTMPGMSGTELAEQASSLQPGIKIVLASGFAADMLRTGWPLLEKPYSRNQLAQIVRRAFSEPLSSGAGESEHMELPPSPGKPAHWYDGIIDRLRR